MYGLNDDDYVYSFQPRKYDGPTFVAETREDLVGLFDTQLGAEQCDGCGNNVYGIHPGAGNAVWAVCELDESPDEFTMTDPCGARYQVTLTQVRETVF